MGEEDKRDELGSEGNDEMDFEEDVLRLDYLDEVHVHVCNAASVTILTFNLYMQKFHHLTLSYFPLPVRLHVHVHILTTWTIIINIIVYSCTYLFPV